MSKTLFNYFKKVDSPKHAVVDKKEPSIQIIDQDEKENSKPASINLKQNEPSPKKKLFEESKKNQMEIDSNDDDIKRVKTPSVKRKRLIIASDSEEDSDIVDENSCSSNDSNKKNKAKKERIQSDSEEDIKKPINKNLKLESSTNVSSPKTPSSKSKVQYNDSPASKSLLEKFSASTTLDSDQCNTFDGKYKHYSYTFLEEERIKDIEGRLKTNPDYDPRTLYVPNDFKKQLTPGLRQWWTVKSKNFDVIIFFKVGKFYELYHMDAVIAVKELGLTFMKGDYAHCGFPEVSFSRFADALVSKGYKVGRVEQTETPDMMAERVRGTKEDKTVRRELCRITTPGTKTFNLLDSEVPTAFSQYLFSITEKVENNPQEKAKTFGVCFVDTTVGKIFIGQFEDDRNCSKLRTTLAHYPAAHILFEKSKISKETKHIIDLQDGLKEGIQNDKEMMNSNKLLKLLSESDYFKDEEGNFSWPQSFKPLLSDTDPLGLTCKSSYELALNAMGGIVWCLKNCLIDFEILTTKNFEIYEPVDNITAIPSTDKSSINSKFVKQKYMVLDSISLTNLEVIQNNFDSTTNGTLYEQVDFCNTFFGKRLLKYWIVNPLCDITGINDRLDAIDDLKSLNDDLNKICDGLKPLPDLERLINKIHQLGNVGKDHPDTRAIMYENDTYSKKKVEDFISLLNGFSASAKLLNSLKQHCCQFKSKLLKSILTITELHNESKIRTGFPHLDKLLNFYHNSFDADQAKKDGKIIPSQGVSKDYDNAIADIENIEKELNSYLKSMNKQLDCKVTFFGTNKNRYQLEMPESKTKHLPKDFELTSSKKGYRRYWTSDIKEMFSRLTDAEVRREKAIRNTMKCLFQNFDKHYNVWNRAVQCLSILDVLISMTKYVLNAENVMCRPEIISPNDLNDKKRPFIDIKDGRHPCLTKTFSGDFIPNDIVIGCQVNKDNNSNFNFSLFHIKFK
jgi:DNA mismatch repair protein MSH6